MHNFAVLQLQYPAGGGLGVVERYFQYAGIGVYVKMVVIGNVQVVHGPAGMVGSGGIGIVLAAQRELRYQRCHIAAVRALRQHTPNEIGIVFQLERISEQPAGKCILNGVMVSVHAHHADRVVQVHRPVFCIGCVSAVHTNVDGPVFPAVIIHYHAAPGENRGAVGRCYIGAVRLSGHRIPVYPVAAGLKHKMLFE